MHGQIDKQCAVAWQSIRAIPAPRCCQFWRGDSLEEVPTVAAKTSMLRRALGCDPASAVTVGLKFKSFSKSAWSCPAFQPVTDVKPNLPLSQQATGLRGDMRLWS